jgi:hypothetical protein
MPIKRILRLLREAITMSVFLSISVHPWTDVFCLLVWFGARVDKHNLRQMTPKQERLFG